MLNKYTFLLLPLLLFSVLKAQVTNYSICAEPNTSVNLNLSEIKQEIYQDLIFDLTDETVYVSVAKNGIGKVTNPSTAPSFSMVCNRSNAIDKYFEIAVNQSQELFVCNSSQIFKIDNNCHETVIANLPENSKYAMSFDSQNNLYVGGSHPRVYRAESDDLTDFDLWHEFDNGHPAGDFVVIDGYMYIAWQTNSGSFIYKVNLTDDFQYISHQVLGAIPTDTYGMAAEYGKLFGVTPDSLYEINLNPFNIQTVINNPNSSYNNQWWGAAGKHEAIDFDITFHLSEIDATNNLNAIAEDIYTVSNTTTFYIRVENIVDGTFTIQSIEIEILPKPIVDDITKNFCVDSIPDFVDLTDYQEDITQEDNVEFSFYSSYQDAELNNSVIANPTNYTNINTPITFYVRVENDDCYSIAALNFDIITTDNIYLPTVNTCENQPATLIAPDGYDLYEWINLSSIDSINNDVEAQDVIVTSPAIYEVVLYTNAGCTTSAFIEVIWDSIPHFDNLSILLCESSQTNYTYEDLISNLNQDLSSYEIQFYLNEEEANNSEMLGLDEVNLQNTSTIYTRISDVGSECFTVAETDVSIGTYNFNLEDLYKICDGESIELSVPEDNAINEINWIGLNSTDDQNNDGHSNQIIITAIGDYSVEVVLDNGCSFTHLFVIESKNSAIIEQIQINANEVTILASGTNELQYNLNGIDFQTRNLFYDLSLGDFIVYVKAEDVCGIVTQSFSISNFTNIITPNGDGFNDYWTVPDIHNDENNSILIYNRYGKLLFDYPKQALPWNGTYLGRKLPSASYFYIIQYTDGKQKKGFLTIKNK